MAKREPLPFEPRSVPDLIGRRLTVIERWRFRLMISGWKAAPYLLRISVCCLALVVMLPLYLLSLLMQWAGERGEKAAERVRDFLAPERSPWSIQPGETRNLLENERVLKALRRMGVYSEPTR